MMDRAQRIRFDGYRKLNRLLAPSLDRAFAVALFLAALVMVAVPLGFYEFQSSGTYRHHTVRVPSGADVAMDGDTVVTLTDGTVQVAQSGPVRRGGQGGRSPRVVTTISGGDSYFSDQRVVCVYQGMAVVSLDGCIRAIRLSDGKQVWALAVRKYEKPVVVTPGRLLVTAEGEKPFRDRDYCIDAGDGRVIWSGRSSDVSLGAAGRIYSASEAVGPSRSATLKSIDAVSGRTVWTVSVEKPSRIGGLPAPRVAAASGRWLVLEWGEQDILLDAADGHAAWSAKLGRILALTDEALMYVPHDGTSVVCWDPVTRAERWRVPCTSEPSEAFVSGGLLLLRGGVFDPKITAYDLASGEEVLSERLRAGSAPVSTGGYVYLHEGSRVSAYPVKEDSR